MDHHAYIYEGSMGEFEALKEEIKPYVAQRFEKFGVDDARGLIDQAALKREGESVYLIATPSITTEAQQALLKLFEEPRQGVVFILLVPHGSLLPTPMSRMMKWGEPKYAGQKVLGSPVSQSLRDSRGPDHFARHISVLLKEEDKDKVRDYLNALELELSKDIQKNRQALADIAMVRDYMRDRSPSLKMLLEHLALVV